MHLQRMLEEAQVPRLPKFTPYDREKKMLVWGSRVPPWSSQSPTTCVASKMKLILLGSRPVPPDVLEDYPEEEEVNSGIFDEG